MDFFIQKRWYVLTTLGILFNYLEQVSSSSYLHILEIYIQLMFVINMEYGII